MLDITGNDIAALNDSDLRSLIGLLCEAELRSAGIPTAGVTWGGHQNASDGGIDVRVDLTTSLHNDGFIPRSKTGFQVKKPDMPKAAINKEMRSENQLKQVIKELADNNGAYIIVSSQGSTADSVLRNRKTAMQAAVSDYTNANLLKVDFYDRERVASWVRTHPSLILWVRHKIGRPIQGWKTYGNWANCPGGIEEAYLTDGHVRLHSTSRGISEGISVTEGINELRSVLSQPKSAVRLVGLSGVGKTRLVQSLFDERFGEMPLNSTQVFYTDMSDSPHPDPRTFTEMLIALQKPITLVVDNCTPELHRRLTSVCSATGSLISLLTVEYDVRDDQPEETEVFRLEPASNELIEKLIIRRFTHISQVGARIIAEFAGGNARIAIALARTVERGENITQLRDHDLFERLFQQRNDSNHRLLKSAEICSLVYSFDIRIDEDESKELKLLGSIIDLSARELYENVSELKRRDLIQQRSHWRAVLPHAVANRLAGRALQDIPSKVITDAFLYGGSERLLKSFSRRLGYLHNSTVAREIAREWLSESGLLGNIMNLNELGIALLKNITPVEPSSTLSLIEGAVGKENSDVFFSRKNAYFSDFTRLLRSIAYDPILFERAVLLLCRFALSESSNENSNSIRKLLKSLFYITLSGTHATPEQRLNIISALLESNSEEKIEIGFSLLSAALEASHFSSSHGFEFGAHARDYGWSPRNRTDINQWFNTFLNYLVPLASSDNSLAAKLRGLLSIKFRGLWTRAKMYNELELAARNIVAKHSWNEGWAAVKSTKSFDSERMEPDVTARLDNLAKILAPTTLIENARLYTLSGTNNALNVIDIIEDESDSAKDYSKASKIARSLGQEISSQLDLLDELLPELLGSEGIRIFDFGQGLSEGSRSPIIIWNKMLMALYSIPDAKRNYQLFRGFLNGISKTNYEASETLLNEAVTDPLLSKVFPYIQTSVDINEKGIERLKQALELSSAPIGAYQCLAYGKTLDGINDKDFCDLLRMVASKNEGYNVAIAILTMRIHGEENVSDVLTSLGQELLVQYPFTDNNVIRRDYELAKIVECCFSSEDAKEKARIVANKIAVGLRNYNIYPSDFDDVLKALASTHPIVFLDIFLEERETNHRIARLFLEEIYSSSSPMSVINDDVILSWGGVKPDIRYPNLASAIVPYRNIGQGIEWTPLAMTLIMKAPDQMLVLNQLKQCFRPSSWEGSRAEIMQSFVPLLVQLQKHEDPIVSQWAIQEEKTFSEEISSVHKWELAHEGERNERFEW
ncbi:hypothetical protein FHS18_000128 [Paenibacillus phyllosphaerae]|uniref:Uncharacterized protein n=1 Tax=Paenibacillus phyllosphaerae TaxID=274593 RepID=A0A7W5FKF4_9BACL|nr:hypothetical protein [Paenibacillus phyllosphaerae]MBB3108100.1 hypothetical protein [Paenibacillus phyllosphaerae]